jgi:hypothetical protein
MGLQDYEIVTGDLLTTNPRSFHWEGALQEKLKDLHKEQAQKTIEEIERLLVMGCLQKLRLEQWASKDNWASDALSPVNHKLEELSVIHSKLQQIKQGYYY